LPCIAFVETVAFFCLPTSTRLTLIALGSFFCSSRRACFFSCGPLPNTSNAPRFNRGTPRAEALASFFSLAGPQSRPGPHDPLFPWAGLVLSMPPAGTVGVPFLPLFDEHGVRGFLLHVTFAVSAPPWLFFWDFEAFFFHQTPHQVSFFLAPRSGTFSAECPPGFDLLWLVTPTGAMSFPMSPPDHGLVPFH